MRDLRSLACLAALGLVLPLVSGCFKYKETITIEQSGRGTVAITASIPEKTSRGVVYYDATKVTQGQIPPPINAGVIDNMFLSSGGVKVTRRDISVEPVNGQWEYEVVVEFASLEALSHTKYFKDRGFALTFPGGRQMKVAEKLAPLLVEMAKSEAKNLPKDAYAPVFLTIAAQPEFSGVVDNAELSYAVTMPGISATADPTLQCIVAGNPDNTTTATWSYTYKDLSSAAVPPSLSLGVDLPAERGFMPVIIALLLASVVGILAPSIRLLMLKSHRAA